jgi:hypothetical protein
MEVRADVIPNYIRSNSPDGLRMLCMKNNAKSGKFYKYDIIFDGKFWYAWYYSDVFEMPQGVK